MQALYEKIMRPSFTVKKGSTASQVLANIKSTDKLISQMAPAWPISQIAPIDLAILRLSVWELMFKKEEPYKVIVDEAVEIAKEFGGEASPKFINGVLGSIIKSNIEYQISK